MNISAQKNILLVEDDPITALAQSSRLERFGYCIKLSTSGEEAIEIIQSNETVDLILMDIDLGAGMDGTETARQILQLREIPLVFLSSHTEPEIVDKTEGITSYGYIVKSSDETVLNASIKMAFRLHDASRKLIKKESEHEASESKYYELFDKLEKKNTELQTLLEGAIAVLNMGNFTKTARRIFDFACQLTGAQSGYVALLNESGEENEVLFLEAGGLPCSVDPELPMPIRGLRAESYKSGRAVYDNDFMNSEWIKFMPQGHVVLRNVMFAPLNIDGITMGIMGLANKPSDFTDADMYIAEAFGNLAAIALQKSRSLELLQIGEANLSSLIENTDESIWAIDRDYEIIVANSRFKQELLEIYNINEKKLNQFNIKNIYSKTDKWMEYYERAFNGEKFSIEIKENYNGNDRYMDYRFNPIIADDSEIKGVTVFGRDTTERRHNEDEIRKLYSEQNIILREVHHRIKNNMSSLRNLLYLQMESSNNVDTKGTLKQSIGRITSMAELYEKMLLNEDYDELSVESYANDLIDRIVEIFQEKSHVTIHKEIKNFNCRTKTLFPLGIIINELVTNIMKYAFPDNQQGEVHITLKNTESTGVLEISDNGIGLPSEFDIDTSNHFGLMLVKMLSRQIGGQFLIKCDNGTFCTVTFAL